MRGPLPRSGCSSRSIVRPGCHYASTSKSARSPEQFQPQGTCLDVCPTSSAALGVYPTGGASLPRLLAAGVRCSLNADDPLLFGCGILDEYELCRNEMDLGDADLAAMAAASLEASGARADLVERATAEIGEWLRESTART
jgi:adenosine deaminase